jgi:MSHA pilin protein MshD
MTSAAERGFTLIELIVFIVVVSTGLVGILSVMNATVQFSAEPMARKQAMVLAESILEEVVQKDYADTDLLDLDPDLDPKAEHVKDTLRANMDDVDDYSGTNESIFTDWPASLSSYKVNIGVVETQWSVTSSPKVPVKKITVTVTGGGHTISLSGYRADY